MRTTIRLEPLLMKQLKQFAAETHRTLTSIIEDAVRDVLYRRKQKPARRSVKLPTFRGKLRSGVDLDSNAALLDLMEQK